MCLVVCPFTIKVRYATEKTKDKGSFLRKNERFRYTPRLLVHDIFRFSLTHTHTHKKTNGAPKKARHYVTLPNQFAILYYFFLTKSPFRVVVFFVIITSRSAIAYIHTVALFGFIDVVLLRNDLQMLSFVTLPVPTPIRAIDTTQERTIVLYDLPSK